MTPSLSEERKDRFPALRIMYDGHRAFGNPRQYISGQSHWMWPEAQGCTLGRGRETPERATPLSPPSDQPLQTPAAYFSLAYVIRSAWLTAFQGSVLRKTVLPFNKPG